MCIDERKVLIAICIYTIVQSYIHMSYCFNGVDMCHCKLTFEKQTGFNFFWYYTYFHSDSCTKISLSTDFVIPSLQEGQSFFDWNEVSKLNITQESAYRRTTCTINYLYIIFDTLLIVTSLFMLIGACFCFICVLHMGWSIPWIIAMGIVVLCDMVVGSWFASHVTQTYGFRRWYHYVNMMGNVPVVCKLSHVIPHIKTAWPAIYMTLIFTRLFIFWYINVCALMYVIQGAIYARAQKARMFCFKSNLKCRCKEKVSEKKPEKCECKLQGECQCKSDIDCTCNPQQSTMAVCPPQPNTAVCQVQPNPMTYSNQPANCACEPQMTNCSCEPQRTTYCYEYNPFNQ